MKNKKTNRKRKIDYKVERNFGFLKNSFSFIERREIKAWQAISIVAFVAGVMGAIIWAESVGIHLGSRASGETAVLSLSPANVSVRRGESFNLNVLLNTNNSNVVAVRADVSYDNRDYALTGWNTTNSVFSSGNSCVYDSKPCEIVKESSSNNTNTISFVLAKPSPGVKTSSGKIATLNFKATDNSTTDNITIKFSGVRNYTDSDVILSGSGSDGPGTDILSSVTNSHIVINTNVIPENSKPVYRFYSDKYKAHLYTASEKEKNNIISNWPSDIWKFQGTEFYAYSSSSNGMVPMYRFWSRKYHTLYYTISDKEKNNIISNWPIDIWEYQGIKFYVSKTQQTGMTPVYKFWSPKYKSSYFITSPGQRDCMMKSYSDDIWRFDGTVWWVPEAGADLRSEVSSCGG